MKGLGKGTSVVLIRTDEWWGFSLRATTALDERFHNSRTSGTRLGVEPRERSTAPHAP
jgi:hypothetical protein